MNNMKKKLIASATALAMVTTTAHVSHEQAVAQPVVPNTVTAAAQENTAPQVGQPVAEQNFILAPILGLITGAGFLAVIGIILASMAGNANASSSVGNIIPTDPVIPSSPTSNVDSYQASVKIFNQINDHRRMNGLPPLNWSGSLYSGATSWSNTMASQSKMYHDPSNNNRWYENVAMTSVSDPSVNPGGVFEQWRNSPGHNSIMLDKNIKYGTVSIAKGSFYHNGRAYDAWYATFRATSS